MADENKQAVEDEDTTPAEDLDQKAEQAPEVEESEGDEGAGEAQTDAEGDDDDVVIAIGDEVIAGEPDEEDDKSAPAWVKDVRKRNRELERELATLRAAQAKPANADPEIEVGEKPTLDGCKYDEDEFERQLLEWTERKRQADARKAEAEKQREAAQKDWQARLTSFAQQREALKQPDVDDAEAVVASKLTREQMAVIVKGARQYNSAAIVYALGKSPARLEKLAEIKDPVDFAIAVGRLSSEVKVDKRKKAPPKPETVIRGSASMASTPKLKEFERARHKAAQTGNWSEVIKLRKQLKAEGINPDA